MYGIYRAGQKTGPFLKVYNFYILLMFLKNSRFITSPIVRTADSITDQQFTQTGIIGNN